MSPAAPPAGCGALHLLPPPRLRAIASSAELGPQLAESVEALLRDRHIILAGDSTVRTVWFQLIAYVRAIAVPSWREAMRGLSSYDAMMMLRRDCAAQQSAAGRHRPRSYCSFLGQPFCRRASGCHDFHAATVGSGHATFLWCQGFHRCMGQQRDEAHWIDGNVTAAVAWAEERVRRKAAVVVFGVGLHLLQLWPVRSFEPFYPKDEGATSAGWNRDFEAHSLAHAAALRAHLGPEGLLLFRTPNSLCEERHVADYRQVIRTLTAGGTIGRSVPSAVRGGRPTRTLVGRAECDDYVRRLTGTRRLGCIGTQLSKAGARALALRGKRALCAGGGGGGGGGNLAPVRIFDAFALTASLGCDNRSGDPYPHHYPNFDFIQLKAIAEGIAEQRLLTHSPAVQQRGAT